MEKSSDSDRERDEHEMRRDAPGSTSKAAQATSPKPELEIRRQHERRDQADQRRADGAAERDHQVEARQVARRGLQPRELAVAEHAGEEKPGAEHADLQLEPVRRGCGRPACMPITPSAAATIGGEELAPVPAAAVEAEDEGQEVDRQRQRSTGEGSTRCSGRCDSTTASSRNEPVAASAPRGAAGRRSGAARSRAPRLPAARDSHRRDAARAG